MRVSRAIVAAAATLTFTTAARADGEPDAQLRDEQALLEVREAGVRANAVRLDARGTSALEEARRLAEVERDLAARERAIDVREARIASGGEPDDAELESAEVEASLASEERNRAARERSIGAALDAARGRERHAAEREEAEREEAKRLGASIQASPPALRLEAARQALRARSRQLAALEARLEARQEWLDAFERQNGARRERLDAWKRRLDARTGRLDLLERRLAEASGEAAVPHAAVDPRAVGGRTEGPRTVDARAAGARTATAASVHARTAGSSHDVAVVVRAPTSIVKAAGVSPARGSRAPASCALESGESGKRQVREALRSVRGSIEACFEEPMEQRSLARADGVLNVTVSTEGKVSRLESDGDVDDDARVRACLAAASSSWSLPCADGAYTALVPITVIHGGHAESR